MWKDPDHRYGGAGADHPSGAIELSDVTGGTEGTTTTTIGVISFFSALLDCPDGLYHGGSMCSTCGDPESGIYCVE